ncbi:MarR family winged helix-turn-helix transcriptional regulator [Clostridium scatologenes]|uniref:Transcriptional regulator, MarR family n=1 Tax=Clostridium scatologenes TaxID=1548 RepID=A0A0E3GRS8_CLOSL|nr:MarR family winged helix-turn-helix transcriptional regulator [Clostridium scatologenes]AKA70846.1 transcriptional regulator, MarR family [Clostridium scatologenes]
MLMDKIYEIVKEIQSISKLINKKISNNTKCEKFTLSAFMILNQLRSGKVKTLTELGKTLGIPNSTVSVIVDRLVNMGIVRRERDKDDRRKVLLCIESEGIDQDEQIFKYHMDNFGKLFRNASEEEIKHILKGLKTLENVIMRG